ADGIVSGPCGGGPFVGPNSPVITCIFDFDGTSVTYGASDTGAGGDRFLNHTSPVHAVGALAISNQTFTISVTSFPAWDEPTVPTFLRLDGAVTIVSGFVDILFQGFLGDALVNQIGSVHFDTPGLHPLSFVDFNPAAPTATSAKSVLTVTVHGIARYDVGA